MASFIADIFTLQEDYPRYIRSILLALSVSALAHYVTSKRYYLLASQTLLRPPVSRFSVPVAKRFIFPSSGRSTSMAPTSARPYHTSSSSTTPTPSSYRPRSSSMSPRSSVSMFTGSVAANSSKSLRVPSNTSKTVYNSSRRRRSMHRLRRLTPSSRSSRNTRRTLMLT